MYTLLDLINVDPLAYLPWIFFFSQRNIILWIQLNHFSFNTHPLILEGGLIKCIPFPLQFLYFIIFVSIYKLFIIIVYLLYLPKSYPYPSINIVLYIM